MKYVTPVNGDTSDLNRPWVNADPANGIEGSIPDGAAIEHPQREILKVITEAGLTPTGSDLTQLWQALQLLFPRRPAGAIILYVRPDGNDANDGSANTSAKAFATISGAITNGLSRFFFAPGITARIQLGTPGTYENPTSLPYLSTVLEIRGDPANQSGYVIAGAGALSGGSSVVGISSGVLQLNGVTISNTGAINSSLVANSSGFITCRYTTFLTSAPLTNFALAFAGGGGSMRFDEGCIWNASAGYMWLADGGTIAMSATQTLQSTPSFNVATLVARNSGSILRGSTAASFAGTGAFGQRYYAELNGTIDMLFGGSTFIPGNVAGTTATGGQVQ